MADGGDNARTRRFWYDRDCPRHYAYRNPEGVVEYLGLDGCRHIETDERHTTLS